MSESSVKQDKGKLRLDLLPWDALDEVGKVLTYGVIKYPNPEENWREKSKPKDIKRYKAALLRHYSAMSQGELVDPESGLAHMAHIATNALFIIALEKQFMELSTVSKSKAFESLEKNFGVSSPEEVLNRFVKDFYEKH